jgi:hypothetical protein
VTVFVTNCASLVLSYHGIPALCESQQRTSDDLAAMLYACMCMCILVNSDPSEIAILKGFDFAIDNSGIAMDIIKDELLREQAKYMQSSIILHICKVSHTKYY